MDNIIVIILIKGHPTDLLFNRGIIDTEDTLTHEDVADGLLDVVGLRVTGRDEVAITELHHLGTLGAQLSGNDHFATGSSVAHHEVQHTVASAANRKPSCFFVSLLILR